MPPKRHDPTPISQPIPPRTPSPGPSTSRQKITPDEIHQRLLSSDVPGSYLATPHIAQRTLFIPTNSYDILVPKTDTNSEFILRGVFQIAHNDFFFTPDGNFVPGNLLGTHFHDTKLNCRLTCPPANEFDFATQHFPACVEALHNLEKLIKHEKNEECLSSVVQHLQNPQIKLTHSLFDAKNVSSNDENADIRDDDNNSSDTENEQDTNFAMETWPVAERCEPELHKLLNTHDICPLPAYTLDDEIIPPTQYREKLKGAIVEVHFALGHYFIKKTKRHIFNAILRKLIVLHRPTEVPSSPYKRLRVSAHTKKKRN